MIKLLQSLGEIEEARSWLRERDIDFTRPFKAFVWRLLYAARYRAAAPSTDRIKSWDIANIVQLIELMCPSRTSAVLDLGCYNSEILWALHALGYNDLHGCDLNPLCKWMPYWTRIHYSCADMTRTGYPANRFSVLTAVSAIEHGVPIDALACEAARLLRSGGLFLLTTDYDGSDTAHNTAQERIFGQAWRIFDRDGLQDVVDAFRNHGLELVESPADAAWQHESTPIEWSQQRYTFALLAFRRARRNDET